MAFTYNSVAQQVQHMFGNVLGATVATAATNYAATMSNSTVKGPDFIPKSVEDAVLESLMQIVRTITETPIHPERTAFIDTQTALSVGALIPRTGPTGGVRVIGIPGFVRDTSSAVPLIEEPLEKVLHFNRFGATVYNGKNEYWFAIDTNRIFHTRSVAGVSVDLCVFDKPSSFSGNVPLDDHHEMALVMGAVMRLAPKENMYMGLFEATAKVFSDHLASIRAYANPVSYGEGHHAPSST